MGNDALSWSFLQPTNALFPMRVEIALHEPRRPLSMKKGRVSSMKERASSFMTERAVSTTGQGPRVVWRRDELAVGALAECFQSFIRPRWAGRSVVRRLEGSIKWAAVSRVVGEERPLTSHELARVSAVHRRVWRRRRLRGGPRGD